MNKLISLRIKLITSICLTFVLHSVDVNAQVSLIQNTIDKLESYKNFSYKSIFKQKEFASDTLISQSKDVFFKAPEDKAIGYLFSIEKFNETNQLNSIDLYNGQNLIHITPDDSTYVIMPIRATAIEASIFGHLNWIKAFAEKNPSKIAKSSDTVINAIPCSHLIVNTRDTIINKEHFYTRIHLFIEKLSGVPNRIITISRNADIGNAITNYYTENRYFDYKFNKENISAADFAIPKSFHPPKERTAAISLLATGTIAPDWTLYAADGRKISLTELKGKVILLDYFFIGCYGCMLSLKPLNYLHEKYKNQNVVILSVTYRDNEQDVAIFKKKFNIKYPIYTNVANMVKSYHVDSFPTFYFIDEEGKVANVIVGYDNDFETKASSIIDNLLNK